MTKGYLAIAGGKGVVPEELKVKWSIITREDKDAVMAVLERGTIWGLYAPEVVELQEDFARYIGTKYCIAVNSGTAALHMAVAAVAEFLYKATERLKKFLLEVISPDMIVEDKKEYV